MSDLLDRLTAHVGRGRLFPEQGRALVAVSGGVDSVALLGVMHELAPRFGLDLAVAHVDHGILSESADVAEAVLGLAFRLGVPGYLRSLNLGPGTSETEARGARYEALRSMARDIGARYILTAHHADDQVETVLFRVLQGSGPAGLAGIPSLGRGGLVRPLLPFRKWELRQWVRTRWEDTWVHDDETNRSPVVDRSWIRHHLLPSLRDRFGEDVEARVLAVSRQADADRAAWSSLLGALPDLEFQAWDDAVEVARAPLQKYDKELCEALLRALAREIGCVLGPARAARLREAALRAQSGRFVELGHGWVAEIAFGRLRLFRQGSKTTRGRETSPGGDGTRVEWGDEETGTIHWGRWVITWRRQPAGQLTRCSLTTWVVGSDAWVRGPEPGDRLNPLGGVGRRPVSRLLMEGRVPRSKRSAFPVVGCGSDIVWLPGICRAESAAPAPGQLAVRLDASVR